MNKAAFPGHQTDERILYFAKPHIGMKYFVFLQIFLVGIFLIFTVQLLFAAIFPYPPIQLLSLVITIALIAGTFWWIHYLYEGTEIFITDRRVVKFVPTTPFHRSPRSLFFDQAMKVKTYYKNPIIERFLKIGSVEIHSRHHEKDNVDVDHVIFHKDLGNYLDKLLFLTHNKPEDLPKVREFVPKKAGERY